MTNQIKKIIQAQQIPSWTYFLISEKGKKKTTWDNVLFGGEVKVDHSLDRCKDRPEQEGQVSFFSTVRRRYIHASSSMIICDNESDHEKKRKNFFSWSFSFINSHLRYFLSTKYTISKSCISSKLPAFISFTMPLYYRNSTEFRNKYIYLQFPFVSFSSWKLPYAPTFDLCTPTVTLIFLLIIGVLFTMHIFYLSVKYNYLLFRTWRWLTARLSVGQLSSETLRTRRRKRQVEWATEFAWDAEICKISLSFLMCV